MSIRRLPPLRFLGRFGCSADKGKQALVGVSPKGLADPKAQMLQPPAQTRDGAVERGSRVGQGQYDRSDVLGHAQGGLEEGAGRLQGPLLLLWQSAFHIGPDDHEGDHYCVTSQTTQLSFLPSGSLFSRFWSLRSSPSWLSCRIHAQYPDEVRICAHASGRNYDQLGLQVADSWVWPWASETPRHRGFAKQSW